MMILDMINTAMINMEIKKNNKKIIMTNITIKDSIELEFIKMVQDMMNLDMIVTDMINTDTIVMDMIKEGLIS